MDSTGDNFISKTKYQYLNLSDQMKGINPPSLQLPYPENMEIISLPNWDDLKFSQEDIASVINLRKSIRSYQQIAISLSELSYLLWCTQGVKEVISDIATKRTVPSAGARHAL